MANELLLINPRKRRRRRKKSIRKVKRAVTVRVSNPRKRRRSYSMRKSPHSRYRRNPRHMGRIGNLGGLVQNTIMPSVTAAGGAIALDVIFGYLPIPANLKTGPLRPLVKGAGAIGLGMLASMFVNAATAKLFTTGALTVVLHDTMRNIVGRFAPNLALGDMGYEWSGYNPELGEYLPQGFPDYTGMGMYLEPPVPEIVVPESDNVGDGYNYY